MRKHKTEHRFKTGDIVCAKVRPVVSLAVRLYARNVYYCIVQNDPLANEMVYFESELKCFDSTPPLQKI
ncbi:hypothetical protein ACJD0Z_08350 [Flavobacteriaceae bacterium M23B6Z8]